MTLAPLRHELLHLAGHLGDGRAGEHLVVQAQRLSLSLGVVADGGNPAVRRRGRQYAYERLILDRGCGIGGICQAHAAHADERQRQQYRKYLFHV